MAASKIIGRNVNKRKYIELHGMYGVFDLPNKSVKVRYFSTVASGNEKQSDSYALLKELKPMRERVKASRITDLSFLLQRNLDDYRVAYELIPYLLKSETIAFFPAVLAIVMPKNILNEDKETHYPTASEHIDEQSGNKITNFEEKWKVEQFYIENGISRLGILSIDLNDVDVVVLDGQHRANAFRVTTGAFSEKDSSVYPAFYKNIPTIENFNADLPITLVWFEYESGIIDPKLISRRLFVDVNNSAKKVSKSRRILLNDFEVPALLTRFFYSYVAENYSFSLDHFSLFHSEFDKDSDISVSSNNVMAITNPEFIYEIFSWITLGSRAFNSLTSYKSKDFFKNNVAKFAEIFTSSSFNGNDIVPDEDSLNYKFIGIKDSGKIKSFEQEYLAMLNETVVKLFSEFNLFKQHYSASSGIGSKYEDGWNTTQMLVWDEVFRGGEGLYYTFKNKEIKDKANESLKQYIQAIDEIEKEFRTRRAGLFEGCSEREVNACFESVETKAFQVGLFMALDAYKKTASFNDTCEDFLNAINGISPKNWVIIMTEIKSALIKGVDPKLWPTYQKLILRLIQTDKNTYYNADNFLDAPDGKIFQDLVKKAFDAWWSNNDELSENDLSLTEIGPQNINRWAKSAGDEIQRMFNKAGITEIKNVNFETVTSQIIQDIINRLNPSL